MDAVGRPNAAMCCQVSGTRPSPSLPDHVHSFYFGAPSMKQHQALLEQLRKCCGCDSRDGDQATITIAEMRRVFDLVSEGGLLNAAQLQSALKTLGQVGMTVAADCKADFLSFVAMVTSIPAKSDMPLSTLCGHADSAFEIVHNVDSDDDNPSAFDEPAAAEGELGLDQQGADGETPDGVVVDGAFEKVYVLRT